MNEASYQQLSTPSNYQHLPTPIDTFQRFSTLTNFLLGGETGNSGDGC
jgi:hypothetical protein